jgi:hypothetical protein
MLIRMATLERIFGGEVTLAFRRWKRATVRTGGTLRTARGLLEIVAVKEIGESALTTAAARKAGYGSRAELLKELARFSGGELYCIELRPGGSDPRQALRGRPVQDEGERAELLRRLERMDLRSTTGPWTLRTLTAIRAQPGRRAAELASEAGQPTPDFKRRVRRLKELGLTESLETGYRLSARGSELLSGPGGGASSEQGTTPTRVGCRG